LKGIYE